MELHGRKFMGYRRDNGRVGIRNHVIVLPVDDISNAAAEAVANNIKGTLRCRIPTGACSSARIWSCTSAP